MSHRAWSAGLAVVLLVYLHNALPYLTTLPRVNVDEPWLMERGYQVMLTGIPSQPMLGLHTAYLLQIGYGYLLAPWMFLFGVGLFQARLLAVCLGSAILVMVAFIGKRTIEPATGLLAALFLALDSNFLGAVRSARTDIPSLFFVVAAFAAYLRGRSQSHATWFVCAGASLGLAMLCHGNAFWAGLILLAWFVLDYRRRAFTVSYGYGVLLGWLLACGPYLAIVLVRWADVQLQIGNFAADRVPGWRPSFVWTQMVREVERYRGWYFGLITADVPNPLLRVFQVAIVAGIVALVVRSFGARARVGADSADPRGPARLLVLAVGAALIFAGFINNKVPVYLPHILIGFALAAGFAVSEVVSRITFVHRSGVTLVLLVAYGATGVAYYEKWYARERKGELVSYEQTEATLRAIVPKGPKYFFASPQFWTPFHAEPGTVFYSFTAAQPFGGESRVELQGAGDDRPIVLVVDEYQWLPELTGVTSSTPEWQRTWISFIEQHCSLEATALGTAHGTLAVYRCGLGLPVAQTTGPAPRIVGGTTTLQVGNQVLHQRGTDLAKWPRYDDPRRGADVHPEVRATDAGLYISGTGWPGIVNTIRFTPGGRYLVRATTERTGDGDLLYLGTWQQPQVRSLSGAASAGMPAPLALPRWFPRDRAFEATAPDVRVLVYSEAAKPDFVISSLDIYQLVPAGDSSR